MSDQKLLAFAFGGYVASFIFYSWLCFKQSRLAQSSARAILILALILHTAALAVRTAAAGHAPFSNMYESLMFFSWAFGLAYLLAETFLKISKLGFIAMLLNISFLVYAFSLDASIKPLMPALQSNWMLLHVSVCFLAYSAFGLSFIASLLYLMPFGRRLLNADKSEELIYQCILFGFPLLTLGIAAGAVWANQAWGTYWSWDPKETWALITWLVYALYLHLRLMKGWQGKKLAWIAFGGFLCVIFTYVGVSYLMSGLHSYA